MYLTYEGALILLIVFVAIPLYHAIALLIAGVRWLSRPLPMTSAEQLPALRQPRRASHLSHL